MDHQDLFAILLGVSVGPIVVMIAWAKWKMLRDDVDHQKLLQGIRSREEREEQ